MLVYGKYELLDKGNPLVYAYTREMEGKKMLMLLNFSTQKARAHLNVSLADAKPLLSNYPDSQPKSNDQHEFTLRPYEAVIYQLQ